MNFEGAPFANRISKLPHFGTASCLISRTSAIPHDSADLGGSEAARTWAAADRRRYRLPRREGIIPRRKFWSSSVYVLKSFLRKSSSFSKYSLWYSTCNLRLASQGPGANSRISSVAQIK